ncbi:MAG: hypothetical protein M1819_000256 [Sarea resinae]|nr:MAG: hypothetical protein M1819_000256 [Sarea resinae]
MAQPNPFLLAAENSPNLLPLLHAQPALASTQDAHGYSLVHAAASYNHISLLRELINDFKVDVNIKDEDGETALFVAENVDIAKCLLEELGAATDIRNSEGMTAEEKIEGEGDFPLVAAFLRQHIGGALSSTNGVASLASGTAPSETEDLRTAPPLPANVTVTRMEETVQGGEDEVVDPEFRRRIEELAARDDFQGEEGQRELRELITEAVRGVGSEQNERDSKRRA